MYLSMNQVEGRVERMLIGKNLDKDGKEVTPTPRYTVFLLNFFPFRFGK